ncbi:hypothetical protein [Paractinoplanes durhamensis]|uniref:Uncharacterized protein n=1 Tax=Paractinoplanes durhamensis TaxID=113563 RepID=A0ABQ3Z200_9ACTN|nr:hypothetical protein [Actinoplanes durhamensis]GIE03816.1 hypothetical protein Adu01nite_51660 [Actinoplanes durhamensis]
MSAPIDPAAVVAEFIDAVAPYDPNPEADPVAVVGVRTAFGQDVFPMSDHVIRALCKALASYRDPDDRGTCNGCGSRRIDENLHCQDCGRLHGILGQVIVDHARRVAAEDHT